MFAGPNGSGKTSLVGRLAKEFSPHGVFHLHPFVNADNILNDLVNGVGVPFVDYGLQNVSRKHLQAVIGEGGRLARDHPFLTTMLLRRQRLTAPPEACDSYAAAAVADFLRFKLLERRVSFSFETVMSHRNKAEFFGSARAEGYRTHLYFIATTSPLLNIRRVQNRVAMGKHAVPADKIIERFDRSLSLLGDALDDAYRAYLFDNSGAEPTWLAELTPSRSLELRVPEKLLPDWFKQWVSPRYQTGRR
jgi:predicted ABC-type ATPase